MMVDIRSHDTPFAAAGQNMQLTREAFMIGLMGLWFQSLVGQPRSVLKLYLYENMLQLE